MQITPVRVFFQKKGRLKYISHLDTMSLLAKALARTKIPVWYTEGYNPHIYLTICMPLSLGYEGQMESLDIKVMGEPDFENIVKSLNKVLPEELSVLEAAEPILPVKDISWADYEIELFFPTLAESAKKSFEKYSSAKEIFVEKKSKKGTIKTDIAPYIKNYKISSNENYLTVSARLASGGQMNVNPRLLWQSFEEYFGHEAEGVRVVRKQILDNQEKMFR